MARSNVVSVGNWVGADGFWQRTDYQASVVKDLDDWLVKIGPLGRKKMVAIASSRDAAMDYADKHYPMEQKHVE